MVSNGIVAVADWFHGLKVWDFSRDRELWRKKRDGWQLEALACSPDGRLLAVSVSRQSDGSLRLWDLNVGSTKHVFERGDQTALAFSPDSQLLATGGGTFGGGQLAMINTRRMRTLYEVNAHKSVADLAFWPGTPLVVSVGNGYKSEAVRFWNVRTGRERRPVPAHSFADAFCVITSPDAIA